VRSVGTTSRDRVLPTWTCWTTSDQHPRNVLRRNFWFASIDDPSALEQVELISEDRVMVETDYPRPDTSWPDVQSRLRTEFEHLRASTVHNICFANAVALCRCEARPTTGWRDPPSAWRDHPNIAARC
jgi:hypothetical protein